MKEHEIFKMKPDHLNFELERFKKNKGLQYLQVNREKHAERSHAMMKRSKTEPAGDLENYTYNPERNHYPNYIP